MKVLVAVKHVVDAYVQIRLMADGSGVDTRGLKHNINPFCEIAVEEAVRMKEQGHASEVVVCSIGEDAVQETLRKALALGADRAVQLQTSAPMQPLQLAKALQTLVANEKPDLVLMGKQSIDGDNNQTAQMLAGLLAWPQGMFASRLELKGQELTVNREVDSGEEIIQLKLPAVVSTDLRLNQPRHVTLPNLMKAKQKPLEVQTLPDLAPSSYKILNVTEPAKRQNGVLLNSVDELLDKLKNEAKVVG